MGCFLAFAHHEYFFSIDICPSSMTIIIVIMFAVTIIIVVAAIISIMIITIICDKGINHFVIVGIR